MESQTSNGAKYLWRIILKLRYGYDFLTFKYENTSDPFRFLMGWVGLVEYCSEHLSISASSHSVVINYSLWMWRLLGRWGISQNIFGSCYKYTCHHFPDIWAQYCQLDSHNLLTCFCRGSDDLISQLKCLSLLIEIHFLQGSSFFNQFIKWVKSVRKIIFVFFYMDCLL